MSNARTARHARLRVGGPLAAAALILFTLGAAGVSASAPETQPVTVDARGIVHPHGGARPGVVARAIRTSSGTTARS